MAATGSIAPALALAGLALLAQTLPPLPNALLWMPRLLRLQLLRRTQSQPPPGPCPSSRTRLATSHAQSARARAWPLTPASPRCRPPEWLARAATPAALLLLACCPLAEARPRGRGLTHPPHPPPALVAPAVASGAALAAHAATAAGIAVGMAAVAISAACSSPDPSSNAVEAQSEVVATYLTQAPNDFSCSGPELTARDTALPNTRGRRRRHRGPLATFPTQEEAATPFALFPLPECASQPDAPGGAAGTEGTRAGAGASASPPALSRAAKQDLVDYLSVVYIQPSVARFKQAVAVAGGVQHSERAAAALRGRLLQLLELARADARAGRSYDWFYRAHAEAIPVVKPSAAAASAFAACILAEAAEIRAAAAASRAAQPPPPAAVPAAGASQVDPFDSADSEEEYLDEVYGHFGYRQYEDYDGGDDMFGDGGYVDDPGGWE